MRRETVAQSNRQIVCGYYYSLYVKALMTIFRQVQECIENIWYLLSYNYNTLYCIHLT